MKRRRPPTPRRPRPPAGPLPLCALGTATLEAAAAADGQPAPRPRFLIHAYDGGPMHPEQPPLPHPLYIDLSAATIRARVALVRDHDLTAGLIGQGTATNDGRQIEATATVTSDSELAADTVTQARNGLVWAASIGGHIGRAEFLEPGRRANVNGRRVEGPAFIARRAEINHIALLAAGADPNAVARLAAAASHGETAMSFDKWLRARGLDPATLSAETRAALQRDYDAEAQRLAARDADDQPAHDDDDSADDPPADPVDRALGRHRARQGRRERIATLAAALAERHPDALEVIEATARTAAAEDWTPDAYELAMLRELRPTVRNVLRGRAQADPGREMLCATLQTLNLPTRGFDDRELEAAHRRYPHGISLGEILLAYAHRNGYQGYSTRDVQPLLAAAFAPPDHTALRAGSDSLVDLPNLLVNVTQRVLDANFLSVEQTWRAICRIRPAKDFRAFTVYRLTGTTEYEEVNRGGELKLATLGENAGATNQVHTHGRLLVLDRQDIVDDDLGILQLVPAQLGRGAGLAINKAVYTAFMNNASFFTAARGNFDDGADSALGAAGLAAANVLFARMTGPDGQPLGMNPATLLVPPELYLPAVALVGSPEIRNTTASTIYPTQNAFTALGLTARQSSYLSNAAYTGNSTTAWYLLADPAVMAAVELAFLNGQQTPTIRTVEPTPERLGVAMQCYHDFGAALAEYRAGVKYAGA